MDITDSRGKGGRMDVNRNLPKYVTFLYLSCSLSLSLSLLIAPHPLEMSGKMEEQCFYA